MKRQISSTVSPTTSKHKRSKTNELDFSGEVESSDSEQQGWTKVQKHKQKKKGKGKKAELKTDASRPQFRYVNIEIIKRKRAVGIDEIRELVMHLLADGPSPNWLHIENARSITKVVAILVPGLTPNFLSLPPIPTSATVNPDLPLAIPLLPRTPEVGPQPNIPFIAATFSHACPTRAPGDTYRMHSIHSSFFQTPISMEERNKRMVKRLMSETKNSNPLDFVLTLEQMIENDYPIPSYMADVFEKPPGWLETPAPIKQNQSLLDEVFVQYSDVAPKQKIYAVDCEMCMTEDGNELTRVCIIDFYSETVVYDQLVKPSKPIIDYLTRWSGITAEVLGPVTTTLTQVQEHVLRLLSPPPPNPFSSSPAPTPPPTPILLGHSLESDLKVLKICHPLCIDTALIYGHPRGRPFKPGLAWLTKKWCGREIQTGGDGGHDPEEDARACVELLHKKLEYGPAFGEFKTDMESIFERINRSTRRMDGASSSGATRSAVVDIGNPAMMHGNKATTCVGCKTDEEVLNGLLEVIPSHEFAFGRFMTMANVMGWTTPKQAPDAPPPPPFIPPTPEALKTAMDTLDTQLRTLYNALPQRTALILFTGHSDPRPMVALNTKKQAFDNAVRNKKPAEVAVEDNLDMRWTASDDRELQGAVQLAKRGLLLLGVKY